VARGELETYLASAPGGLKGIVTEERRLRRAESGKPQVRRDAPRVEIARRLRELDTCSLNELSGEGSEDVPLLERAARHLTG